MRWVGILWIAWACLPGSSFADERSTGPRDDEELRIGARVRVSTDAGDRVTGRLEELTFDALRIRPDGATPPRDVSWNALTKIETSRGRRDRKQAAWSKAKWGALLGGVPGAISLGLQHEQVGANGSSVGEAALLGAWSGALLGGLVGAAWGALHPGEAWETLSPSFRIGPRGGPGGGVSLAVTLSF